VQITECRRTIIVMRFSDQAPISTTLTAPPSPPADLKASVARKTAQYPWYKVLPAVWATALWSELTFYVADALVMCARHGWMVWGAPGDKGGHDLRRVFRICGLNLARCGLAWVSFSLGAPDEVALNLHDIWE
jgi:hypothetical protein